MSKKDAEKKRDIWKPSRPEGHSLLVLVHESGVQWMPNHLPNGVDIHISDLRRALQMLGLNQEAIIEITGRKKQNTQGNIGIQLGGKGGADAGTAVHSLIDQEEDDEPRSFKKNGGPYQLLVDAKWIEKMAENLTGEAKIEKIAKVLDSELKKGLVQIKRKEMNTLASKDFEVALCGIVVLSFLLKALADITQAIDGKSIPSFQNGILYVFYSILQKFTEILSEENNRESKIPPTAIQFLKLINFLFLFVTVNDLIQIERVKRSLVFSRRQLQ